MAKFKPGDPKRGGRAKGTPNKSTEQFRAMIQEFLEANWSGLQKDFDAMKPPERANFMERLLKYIIPEPFTPAKLSEEQLKEVINHLQNERKG